MQTAQNEVDGTLVSSSSGAVFTMAYSVARDLTNFPDKQAEDLHVCVLVQVRTAALAAYHEHLAQFMAAVFSSCPVPQPEVQERLLQLSQQLGLALAESEAAAAAAVASMRSAQTSAAPQ